MRRAKVARARTELASGVERLSATKAALLGPSSDGRGTGLEAAISVGGATGTRSFWKAFASCRSEVRGESGSFAVCRGRPSAGATFTAGGKFARAAGVGGGASATRSAGRPDTVLADARTATRHGN